MLLSSVIVIPALLARYKLADSPLGFSDRVFCLGAGLFSVGYVLFEILGAIIVERWSARKWMARIMISWGLLTVFTGFVHTAHEFYMARFLLGKVTYLSGRSKRPYSIL